MTKARWIWAGAATVSILAALGAGLWFGGGPTTRSGWEASSWAGGITAIAWATTSRSSDAAPRADTEGGGDVVNMVNSKVSGSTILQGHDVHTESPSYDGDHIDFRGATFDGTAIGIQVNHPHPEPGNDGQEPGR